ncbi:agamous-like MADS-box protein AGL80 [Impatiens glandulifera]|uniref:agamous-like MADS-box protein AGL80 n=1 Tax=Impatiens glandulifera TaxID=253017 RepID=UPI001FB08559|nr:agamous-like MADS-box protein AGL80 [Impatiens glandulifera]
MSRSNEKYAFISNDHVRKITFKTRKGGLIKKMYELSTLCGIEGCVIITNKDDPQPIVWPSVEDARKTVERFRSLPEHEQTRWMVNQESFTNQRLKKIEEKLMKLRCENRDKEITQKIYQSMCENPMNVASKLNAKECEEIVNMLNRHIIEMKLIMESREGSFSNLLSQDNGVGETGPRFP